MICFKCVHFGTRTTPSPAQFLLYGCKLKKITFGVESDLKKALPKKCGEYEK